MWRERPAFVGYFFPLHLGCGQAKVADVAGGGTGGGGGGGGVWADGTGGGETTRVDWGEVVKSCGGGCGSRESGAGTWGAGTSKTVGSEEDKSASDEAGIASGGLESSSKPRRIGALPAVLRDDLRWEP